MKTKNVTYSLPLDVIERVREVARRDAGRASVPSGSKLVADILRRGLGMAKTEDDGK